MSGWFRFYADVLNDPKVQKLPAELFKMWVNILCLAKNNNGLTGTISDVSFALRETEESVSSAFQALEKAGLLDKYKGSWEPHNWRKRQFKSDTSTDRVKRYRERARNVTETAPETESDTETETDSETDTEAEGCPPAAAPARQYAFAGKVVRLNQADYDSWKRAYSHIDLDALLQNRDDWLASPEGEKVRGKWFKTTSNWLARKNDEARRTPVHDPRPPEQRFRPIPTPHLVDMEKLNQEAPPGWYGDKPKQGTG